MLDVEQIKTRYAKSGALNIAYQVFGTGDVRLVLIPGWASNVEGLWMLDVFASFASRLAEFAQVALLDRRGCRIRSRSRRRSKSGSTTCAR
jgi:pimeloyl-ACP methyl ester carboxylesterase